MTCRLPHASCFATVVLSLLLGGCGARTELSTGSPERTEAAPDAGAGGGINQPTPMPETVRCEAPSFDYSTEPATVLLLIDRSGSMSELFGSDTRWNVVRDALFSDQEGLVARLGETTRFGLVFYTSLEGFLGGTCPMMDYTGPLLGRPEVLQQAFDSTFPLTDGDTPTGEALLEALAWFDEDNASGPRYLVLITDGEPDTCSEPDPQNGQEQALQAAREAHELGIEMYIVGVSSDLGASHLQQMANVAQGVRAEAQWERDPEAIQPIVASNQEDALARQIQGALGDVRTCTITLDEDVDIEGIFVVMLDGQEVPASEYSIENGQLILSGGACTKVMDDAQTLDIEVPCRD